MPQWGIHLPDDAWVVRGGLNALGPLARSVETAIERWSRPGLSIWAAETPAPIDVIEMAEIPHGMICVSTIGRLRAAGFDDFDQTLDPPHHSLWLPRDWEPALETFRDAFDSPAPKTSFVRNPRDADREFDEVG